MGGGTDPGVLWVDGSSGASGDMLLAALADLGVPEDVMAGAAAAVAPVEIAWHREVREGFAVARAEVRATEDERPQRTWRSIRRLLEDADLADDVRVLALDCFSRLAVAEGRVHGSDPDDVHFHEVGAHDAIGDVVGTCAGLVWLRTTYRVREVRVSSIALGGGTARSAHGTIPVPGPAVLRLVQESGAPVHGGPDDVELCTPTGAALLSTLATAWGAMPDMSVTAVGYGAGSRVIPGRLNALRLVLGTARRRTSGSGSGHGSGSGSDSGSHGGAGRAAVLETNVDDLDPRLWPVVLSALLAAGADDAWLTPILMKKGRPAHTLHVLVPDEPVARQRVERVVFRETSAIGARWSTWGKTALDRSIVTVTVLGQPVRVKLAHLDGEVVNAQPEYDDVVAAAAASGRPPKAVLAAAVAAAQGIEATARARGDVGGDAGGGACGDAGGGASGVASGDVGGDAGGSRDPAPRGDARGSGERSSYAAGTD